MKFVLLGCFFLFLFTIPGHVLAEHPTEIIKIKNSPKLERTISVKSDQSKSFINQKSISNQYKEDGWQLIWHDEFDKNTLNQNNWNTENWAAEKNNELQFYTPDNVQVQNGHLQLVSKKEQHQGRDYTSGAIHSKDKFSFRYGKVEIKAKLPVGQGIFPAIWMMPNIDNTWLPEIDIMEMLGHQPEKIWMVQHWLDDNNQLVSQSDSYVGVNYSKGYHTYSIEWSPEEIIWYIDGNERFKTSTFSPSMDMYLYLNTAIGGEWPGSPDGSTVFPQVFEVDYVRIFQQIGVDQK